MMRAQDGLSGALSDAGTQLFRGSFGQPLAAADFDNDQRPDGAILLTAGEFEGRRLFQIRLHVSAGTNHELTFESNETALAIATTDVNRDGVPDLVVEQVFSRKRIQVWLNDGHGKFRPARVEDFPTSTQVPSGWRLPFQQGTEIALALPTRTGNDHAIQILEVLRSVSSSSHWRVRTRPDHARAGSVAFPFPRPPPAPFSL
jgi:hypothetical protein